MAQQIRTKPQNPVIPMIRQGAHYQTEHERFEDWRMRMLRETGLEPTRKHYKVIKCQVCKAPVWIINPQHTHLTGRCRKH